MLSAQEIEKIKEGIATIRKQVPDADLSAVIKMFNFVFGRTLPDSDRRDAELLIQSEWRMYFS